MNGRYPRRRPAIPAGIPLLLLLAIPLRAQCAAISTPLFSDTGQKGTMFNLVNLSATAITVTGFHQDFLSAGLATFEVYTKAGTWQGFESSPAAWTNLGIAANIAHSGPGAPVAIPVFVQVPIPAGATQAFYLTCTQASGSSIAYATGVNQLHTSIVNDGTIDVRCGVGKSYPFGSTFGLPSSGRVWNGRVIYSVSAMPSFESNDPASSAVVGGVEGSACSPAVTTLCPGGTAGLQLATNLPGNAFEAVVSARPVLPFGGGGFATPNGQVVNLDLGGILYFLNGGHVPEYQPHSGMINLGFMLPAPVVVAVQQVVCDPLHADGYSLSQAAETDVVAVAIVPGPAGDDVSVQLDFLQPPLCAPSPVDFYGTAYTRAFMSSNGRLNFVAPDNAFLPTVAAALAGNPFVAPLWTDLDPLSGGVCDVRPGGSALLPPALQVLYPAPPAYVLGFRWFDVPMFGTSNLVRQHLFAVLGTAPGPGAAWDWIIHSAAIPPMATQAAFAGISRGNPGAIDPGPQAFAPGASGPAPGTSAAAMLYRLGSATGLLGGASAVVFSPIPGGGTPAYVWAAF